MTKREAENYAHLSRAQFINNPGQTPPTTHAVVILRCSCGRERPTFAHESLYADAPELIPGDWQRVQSQYLPTYRDPMVCSHQVRP